MIVKLKSNFIFIRKLAKVNCLWFRLNLFKVQYFFWEMGILILFQKALALKNILKKQEHVQLNVAVSSQASIHERMPVTPCDQSHSTSLSTYLEMSSNNWFNGRVLLYTTCDTSQLLQWFSHRTQLPQRVAKLWLNLTFSRN